MIARGLFGLMMVFGAGAVSAQQPQGAPPASCLGVVAPPEGVPTQLDRVIIPPPMIPGRFPTRAEAGVFISATGTLDSVRIKNLPSKAQKEYERGIRKAYEQKPIRIATWRGCPVGAWVRWGIEVPGTR